MSQATANRKPPARRKRTGTGYSPNAMADYEWLCASPAIVRRHAGEWIAIYEKKVIAHGKDQMDVMLRAQAMTPDYISGYIEDDDEDLIL